MAACAEQVQKIMLLGESIGGPDAREIAAALRHDQAMKNVQIIGAMHSIGLPLDLAPLFGAKRIVQPHRDSPPPVKSQSDLDRIAAAEAKRQRKATKRMKP